MESHIEPILKSISSNPKSRILQIIIHFSDLFIYFYIKKKCRKKSITLFS